MYVLLHDARPQAPPPAARARRPRDDRRGRAGAVLQPVRGLPAARAAREGGRRAAARARRPQRAADRGGADARHAHRRAARPRRGGRGRPAGDRRADHRHACAWRRSSPPACTCSRPRCAGSRDEHPALRVEVTDAEPETSMPALALGSLDIVLADQYPFLPRAPDPRLDLEPLHRGAVPRRAAGRASAGGRRAAGPARRAARRAVGDRQGRQPPTPS